MQLTGPSESKGPWKNSRLQQLILDAVTLPGVTDITVMSSAQIGKTEIRLCITGYYMHHDPVPQMCVDPTLDMAKAFSRNRLAKMLNDTPCLSRIVRSPFSEKKTGQSILHKEYPGGEYTGAGANSTASLAGHPKAVVQCDDVDRFEMTKEGDPLDLAFRRTQRFTKKKRIAYSTPTIDGESRIQRLYNQSDRRVFEVQCPNAECGHWQQLRFDDDVFKFVYDRDEFNNPIVTEAWYECEKCHTKITDRIRRKLLDRMRERITNPKVKTHVGFSTWEIYTPSSSMKDIAQGFLNAKDDPELLKGFYNTVLNLLWKVKPVLGLDAKSFIEDNRIETYRKANDKMMIITCAVDVQDNRLEYQIMGWGMHEESWVLSRGVVTGHYGRSDTWNRLHDILTTEIEYESGMKRMIDVIGVDSGNKASAIYPQVRKILALGFDKAYALKGWSGQNGDSIIHRMSQEKKFRIRLYIVNTDRAKDTLFERLETVVPEEGRVHFNQSCDPQFFEQLTSEVKITKMVGNKKKMVWDKPNKKAANEALDLTVYNLALLHTLMPINWKSVKKRFEKKSEKLKAIQNNADETSVESAQAPKKQKIFKRPRPKFGYKPMG